MNIVLYSFWLKFSHLSNEGPPGAYVIKLFPEMEEFSL